MAISNDMVGQEKVGSVPEVGEKHIEPRMTNPEKSKKYSKSRAAGQVSIIASLLYPLLILWVDVGRAELLVALAPTFYAFTGAVVTYWLGWANGREAYEYNSRQKYDNRG